MNNFRLPVAVIEGIGPAIERALNAAQVFYTSDLLHLTASQLHASVRSMASPEQVEQWRTMARFLELRGMTDQWAEALVRNGIETLEALLKKDFEQLNVLFQSAHTDGLIASVPDAAAILEFSRDAALVFHGGHCMGAVLAPDGTPLHDAAVVVGGLTTSTDERGRYRLIRIPPAAGHTLKIEYAGYATLYEPHFTVDYDSRAVRVQYWTLDAAPVPAPAPEFDEYHGADLPALSCYRTVLRSFPQEDMREGDVLKVHELYASTPHVKLVSIFRASQAGDLVVRYVKVELNRFDSPPAKGEVHRYQDGGFVKVENTVHAIERYRALRKLRSSLKANPEFHSLESAAQIDWLIRTYNEKRVFSRFKSDA